MNPTPTIFARNMYTIARALSGSIYNLQEINCIFGTGYDLSDKDAPNDDCTIYLGLMDGPSATGKVIKTLTASSVATMNGAYIADIVLQFEQQIFDLQDWKGE